MNTIRQLFNVVVNSCQGLFNWSFLIFSDIYLEVQVSAEKIIFRSRPHTLSTKLPDFFFIFWQDL
jgi:hypothetical protein